MAKKTVAKKTAAKKVVTRKLVAKKAVRKEMFNGALEPLAMGLPASMASSVGITLARHAYLDWVLGQVMYSLMEISIKQGRVIMKLPRPAHYIAAVRDLFAFHGLETTYDFDALCLCLDSADRSRNMMTRSVFMRDSGSKGLRIHLTRSPWDPGPGGETQPETQVVDRKFLAHRRKVVDDAIRGAEKLRALTDKLLRNMHEMRRNKPGLNRRRR
jgi:hypothetical protein